MFKYAYEHVTSNIGVEILYLTIYIALECTMSSSPLLQGIEIITINKFNYDGQFVAANIYQVT